MSETTYPITLPTGTELGKSFEYRVDIDTAATPGTPTWQMIRRISAFAPTYPATTQDVASYDDRGSANNEVTGRSFQLAFTVQSNRLPTGLYLPELEALLVASRAIGGDAVVHVRWYHNPYSGAANPTDAGEGYATVEVTRQNTGNADAEWWSVTLTGKGEFSKIENPLSVPEG